MLASAGCRLNVGVGILAGEEEFGFRVGRSEVSSVFAAPSLCARSAASAGRRAGVVGSRRSSDVAVSS